MTRKRGGYCFELNCLFNWLLKELGYTTVSYMARYIRGETGTPIRRHRIIVAESPYTDGRVMCDVGIGDRAPRYALKLVEGGARGNIVAVFPDRGDRYFSKGLYETPTV